MDEIRLVSLRHFSKIIILTLGFVLSLCLAIFSDLPNLKIPSRVAILCIAVVTSWVVLIDFVLQICKARRPDGSCVFPAARTVALCVSLFTIAAACVDFYEAKHDIPPAMDFTSATIAGATVTLFLTIWSTAKEEKEEEEEEETQNEGVRDLWENNVSMMGDVRALSMASAHLQSVIADLEGDLEAT